MIIDIGFHIGKYWVDGSAPSYSAEYQDVLDYATLQGYTLPSGAENIVNNQAVEDAITNGIWDLLDVWWPMKSNADFSTINWKNPGTFDLSPISSPTYDPATGWTGDGATSYLTTGWVPNSSGIFLQNDAGIGHGVVTDISGSYLDFGSASSSGSLNGVMVNTRNASNNYTSRLNNTTTGTIAGATTSIGRYHYKRVLSASYIHYKNGTLVGTVSVASTGKSTFGITILAVNLAGTVTLFSTRPIYYMWAGAGLDGLESIWDTILANLYA